MGFHTTLGDGGRELHTQRSARGDCSVSSGVLSPDFIRQGAGPWRGTFATASCRGDRLAHTALIPGGLPARHRYVVWRERRGVIRPRVQGRPTAAPAPAPFWLRCSARDNATDQVKTNGTQTMSREASHHQVRGRTAVRANQGREGTPRPDVARRAGRVVGNQFGRRLRGAESRVGFRPVPRDLRFLVGERNASRFVNVLGTRSVLVCERIAERFVNAVNREGLCPSGSRVLPDDSVASKTPRADGASAVDGGVSVSEER